MAEMQEVSVDAIFETFESAAMKFALEKGGTLTMMPICLTKI